MRIGRYFAFLDVSLATLLRLPLLGYTFVTMVLFLSGADMAMGRFNLMPIAPTIAAVMMLGLIVALALIGDLLKKPAGREFRMIFRKNQNPIMAYMVVAGLSLLFSGNPTAYWDDGAKWIFIISYGFLIFLVSLLLPMSADIRRYYRLFPFISLLCLVASMTVDVFNPGFFSTELARAAGFPGNANLASIIMVGLCAATLRYDLERSLIADFVVFAVAMFALLMTQSRSGSVELFVLILFYLYVNFFKRKVSMRTIMKCFFGIFGVVAILAIAAPILMSKSAMFQNYNTRFSHLESSSQIDDGSSESRLEAAIASLHLIDKSPIFGHGTAFSRTMEELPHNIYLMQWVNNGIFGVLSYVALLAVGFYTFWKRRFFPGQGLILVATVGGLFSHNMLDQRTFLMLYAILLTLSFPGYGQVDEQGRS